MENELNFQFDTQNYDDEFPQCNGWLTDDSQELYFGTSFGNFPYTEDQEMKSEYELNQQLHMEKELQNAQAEAIKLCAPSETVVLKQVDSGEPAVVLCQEDDVANTSTPETLTKSETHTEEEIKCDINLAEEIWNIHSELKAKQSQLDDGSYSRSGPGRKRKFAPRTSKQLKSLVIDYIRDNLSKIVSNKRCRDRKDALITIYVRALKKLTYYLVEKCAAKNRYKRNEVENFLLAFSESHSSFLFSITDCDELDIVESFISYVVIYFPTEKATELIDILMKQNGSDSDFLRTQKEILNRRDVTSKKNIRKWADHSPIMRQIFSLALDVLQEPKFAKSKVGYHLINVTKHFLGDE